MIVYGDGQLRLSVGDVARNFQKRLIAPGGCTLHELRIRSVIAGQLEQAAIDTSSEWAAEAEVVAVHCSGAFAARVLELPWPNNFCSEGWEQASRMLSIIATRTKSAQRDYPMKIPEGFAWYGVYPDAYVQAALEWARTARKPSCVTVVGLRSAGTTLSSVVTATLRLLGFPVNRITVRPDGDPYRRRVCLPEDLPISDAAIVVDEGPGRSGSSMAAAATALVRHGFRDRAIALFPAHENGPGGESSVAVRCLWREAPIHVGESIRPGAPLCDRTEMGGGLWMKYAGVCPHDVNAVAPMLEAPKFLTVNATRSILWKFSGFTLSPNQNADGLASLSEDTWRRLARLADAGMVPHPVSCEDGWIGTLWIDGTRLSSHGVNASDLSQACKYILAATDPPLEEAEEISARHRLANLLTENVKELCPAEFDRAQRVAEALQRETRLQGVLRYGDGRLAPHEWVRTDAGGLLKLDAGGHACDHTAIGPQAILWDVAGLIVEWNMPFSMT